MRPDSDGDGDRAVDSVGEKTEPLLGAATGVADPEASGEAEPGQVGRDVVAENKFDSEALERRYGRADMEERGDLPSLLLCTFTPASVSDS